MTERTMAERTVQVADLQRAGFSHAGKSGPFDFYNRVEEDGRAIHATVIGGRVHPRAKLIGGWRDVQTVDLMDYLP